MAALHLTGYYLVTHKLAESPGDCQDAISLDASAGVIALADGVTESFYARPWARALTDVYVRRHALGRFDRADWLVEAQERWRAHLCEEIEAGRADLFVQNRFTGEEPACATFLAALCSSQASPTPGLLVEALAVGDTCLLLFSGGSLKASFPLASSSFPPYPDAIASSQAPDAVAWRETRLVLHPGDCLVLATDAMASFLLRACEQRSPVVAEFLELGERGQVEDFVARYRRGEGLRLHNDDIALACLACGRDPGSISDYTFATGEAKSPRRPGPGSVDAASQVGGPFPGVGPRAGIDGERARPPRRRSVVAACAAAFLLLLAFRLVQMQARVSGLCAGLQQRDAELGRCRAELASLRRALERRGEALPRKGATCQGSTIEADVASWLEGLWPDFPRALPVPDPATLPQRREGRRRP